MWLNHLKQELRGTSWGSLYSSTLIHCSRHQGQQGWSWTLLMANVVSPPLLLSRSKMLHVCFRIPKLLIVSISISKEETHKLIFCAHCQWKLKSKPNKTTKNQTKTKQNPKVPRSNVYKFSNRSWKTPIKFGFSSNVPSTPGSSPAPASF